MRLRLLALACVTLVATSGCSDPVAPAPGELVGAWVSEPRELTPPGWLQYHLRFTTGRRFAYEVRRYGLHANAAVNDLTAFQRFEGTFRREGDRLQFNPERRIWWDRFGGSSSPVRVDQSLPWGGIVAGATYEVTGDRLTMHFITLGAADEPLPETAVFTRVE